MKPFNYDQDFTAIDFRVHPEKYQVGKGEQGVLLEPTHSRFVGPVEPRISETLVR